MVYTVTCNPSLDYIVTVDGFKLGDVNRTSKEILYAGGKGINVSTVLTNLGTPSTALGFTAGFTGDEIERRLNLTGIAHDFIRVREGMSRIDVKIRAGEETEINGQGPKVTPEDVEALLKKLDRMREGDVLVLAGSIPKHLSRSLYADILAHLGDRGILAAVDATQELLVNVLPYRPFLIKPNRGELGEIFGKTLRSEEEVVSCAGKMQAMGARNVLVSMAGDGALLLTEEGDVLKGPAPSGKLVNSVGSGDSMVAGFLHGYLTCRDYGEAFRWGICTGSASAFSESLAERPGVEALLLNYHI